MNEREISLNQFLARNPNPSSKSLNNKFDLVLHVFWCVLVMATTVAIPYKDIASSNSYSSSCAPAEILTFYFSSLKCVAQRICQQPYVRQNPTLSTNRKWFYIPKKSLFSDTVGYLMVPVLFYLNYNMLISAERWRVTFGTVRLNRIAHFAVDILLLHQYNSDLSHLSYLYSLVIGMYKYERWEKKN